jgi:hypothetical protein
MTNKELDNGCMGKGIFSADDYLPRDSPDMALGSDNPELESAYPNLKAKKRAELLSHYGNHVAVRRPLMMPLQYGLVRENAVIYSTRPDMPFKATHLLMWGITTETRVVFITVANEMVLPINAVPVSAMLYFTHLDPSELRDINFVNNMSLQLQQQIDAPTCSSACMLRIGVEGPVTAIAFMGIMTK